MSLSGKKGCGEQQRLREREEKANQSAFPFSFSIG